jgi:pathogenesis-related protein 1
MTVWTDESAEYNYANPTFSHETSHFTQVVWKATTQVSCAAVDCEEGTMFTGASRYFVCRYSSPGNVEGQFAENVGRPGTIDDNE